MIKLIELLLLQNLKGFGKVKVNKYLEIVKGTDNIDLLFDILLNEEKIHEEYLLSAHSIANQIYNELLSQSDIKVVTVFDSEYPQGFFSLDSKKPVILYAKGDVSILNNPGVSVVGTRKPSPWTQKFGKNISKQIGFMSGRMIVSGLALGCDRFGHEGALLANVPTVAILPSGVNIITPSSHKKLAKDILEKGGCLLSEYSPNAKAFRTTYVERDSLIAAMTDITYVIECAEKSGTMHTVDAAYKMSRKLACYYPDQNAMMKGARESDYLGNKKMIDKMGAKVIARQDDLKDFFKEIDNHKKNEGEVLDVIPHQMSFGNLTGSKINYIHQ